MTDNEIVKALECCSRGFSCKLCPYYEPCNSVLCRDALDLIKRQQAEIEKMKADFRMADGYADALVEYTKEESVEEFADLLVSKAKSAKERFLLESLVESVMKEMESDGV